MRDYVGSSDREIEGCDKSWYDERYLLFLMVCILRIIWKQSIMNVFCKIRNIL